jgi:hypothetical protein
VTEVEKSSRLIMERTFYTKLGPTPAFPPSPAETGQVKPTREDGLPTKPITDGSTPVQ